MDTDPKNNPQINKPNLPASMTRQQVEAFELLRGLSTEDKQFHKWYQGALEIIDSQSPDKIAQAAHSLRELCDALPDAIAQIPKFKSPIPRFKSLGGRMLEVKMSSYRDGWEGKIISKPLADWFVEFELFAGEPPRSKRLSRALTSTEPQASFLSKDWQRERDKEFADLYGFFQGVAHHNSLPGEAELKEKLQLFESLLLDYLTPRTAAQQKELLSLMTAPPSEKAFARFCELTQRKAANLQFVFEKLENVDWLRFLDEKDRFRNLPGPEPAEGGGIMYPPHLPLMPLTRLAKAYPHIVTDILIKLRLTDNPRVGDQVLQCMSQISNPGCVKRLNPLIRQMGENSMRTSWLWIKELLESWSQLKVFPEILAVLQAYFNSVIEESGAHSSDTHSTWLAKEVDQKFLDDLTARYPTEITEVIFNALSKWAELECKKSDRGAPSNALSSYRIEDFKSRPETHRGIEATLAVRLFSAARQVYFQGDYTAIARLDGLLRRNSGHLFRRLRWQLYADFPEFTLEHARAEVLQRIPFLAEIGYDRGSHDYEFAQLLIAHVKQHGDRFLSGSEVERFVTNVLKGPVDEHGRLLDGNNDFFYRKQLWPIAPLLRGGHLVAYRALVPDDGKIEIESFKPFRSGGAFGGFIVSKAPQEVETFDSMTDESLWRFLNTWEPDRGFERDSSGQLSHQNIYEVAARFADFVAQRPGRFDPKTEWWKNITREEIFNRLLDNASFRLAKNQTENPQVAPPADHEWGNSFGIADWITVQPWSRYAVSNFLRNALTHDFIVPDRHLAECRNLLTRLVEEPDSRLLENRNAFGDLVTTAINSVRGTAIEGLLGLAFRQKREGKQIEPWIFELIRRRLESAEESPAIFALLGTRLRFLISLFAQELKESPALLFPPERQQHCSAAIVAHFKFDQAWNRILETFPGLLDNALAALTKMPAEAENSEAKQNQGDFGLRLGIHIACYYWSGSFAPDSEGESKLDRFFDVASSESRAGLIGQIAWILKRHTGDPLDEKTIGRVMRIWERRHAQIEGASKAGSVSSVYGDELAASFDWLNCECFPFEWRCKQAKSALAQLKAAPKPYHLLEAVTGFSRMPDRLEPMLELLQMLLRRPSNELLWSVQFKQLAPAISLGLKSESARTRKLADECKDLLLKMGFSDFLNLERENG